MAVRWNWKDKLGEICYKEARNGKPITIKQNIYRGENCLAALIYEWKDTETKQNMYQFVGFWNDSKHLKNFIESISKDNNINLKKVKLNTYYKDFKVISEQFTKARYTVTLYYKEPKEDKQK